MNQVRQRAVLHESTVKKAAELRPQPKPRRKGERKVRNVTSLKVDSRVWKKALELAGGDTQRIQVLADDEVIVHNSWRWRRG